MATTFPRRPALVQVPINANANITPTAQRKLGSGGKRSREDDTDDLSATRSSAKRVRLDVTPPTALQIPSLKLTTATPDPLVFTKDKSRDLTKDLAGTTRSVGYDVVRSPKKSSRADKEKSRASKLEAEENFRIKYRAAFPDWKFYFDGVPLGAVNVATRKIEQLGGVVEGFLSKEVTHLILPAKLDKDKENDTQHSKTLSISHPHPLGTLRSPFDLKTGYNPVDRAREWGCKIWDIGKLESVLERTTATTTTTTSASRQAMKPDAPPTSSLQGLLTLEKAYSAISTKPNTTAATALSLSAKPVTTVGIKPATSLSLSTKSLGAPTTTALPIKPSTTHSAKPTAPSVPIFKPKPSAAAPFNLNSSIPPTAPFNLNSTIPLRKLPPPFHATTSTATAVMARDRKLNSASRALVDLLKTEKATNTTMERDPKCQRHDYTYFAKLSAFLIVETVHGDLQMVGRLEYKPPKTTSSTAFNHTRLISFDPRGAFNVAHRGPQGKDLPEYPLLHLDHRMRSPFTPYHPRVKQKESYLDQKDRDDREARKGAIRLFRAHKRAVRENHMRKSMSMSDLRGAKALAAAANHHAQTHTRGADGTNGDRDRASGFIRSTVGTGTGAYDSMSIAASGSVASFSTAFTGGGGSAYPPTTSHLTTSFSLSQSGGGANSWAKFHGHHGASGVVPSFGGVRNATQVVMNRGAFAESTNGAGGAGAGGGEARSRKTSLNRTVSLAAVPVKAEQKIAAGGAAGTAGTAKLGDGKLRRTQSMMAIKPTKEVEPEKKKPEGYCECCKEQFESLSEHIKSRRHRKFAVDPARYKDLDRAIRRMGRITKEQRQIDEAINAPTRAAARERYFQRMHDLIASTQSGGASGDAQPSTSPDKHSKYSLPRDGGGVGESGHLPVQVASEDDPDKTLSSSSLGFVGVDDLETAALLQFFEGHSGHSGSSGPPFTETDGGTVTTDVSACITPVDDLGSMAALASETARHTGSGTGKQKEKEIIMISSDTAAIDSSFEIALASSASAPHLGLLDQHNPGLGNPRTGIRMPHRGTPMPSRIFDMATGVGSTDPAEPESEELALADVLRRKNQALVAQLAQTSEREDDSDGLEILEV